MKVISRRRQFQKRWLYGSRLRNRLGFLQQSSWAETCWRTGQVVRLSASQNQSGGCTFSLSKYVMRRKSS